MKLSEQLFVYGIFLDKNVRLRAFNRDIHIKESYLNNYTLGVLNPGSLYKCVYESKGNRVKGLILTISKEELTHITDKIERIDLGLYKRVKEGNLWVYVKGDLL